MKRLAALFLILAALAFAVPASATINTLPSVITLAGNGVTQIFSVPFTPDQVNNIAVIYTNSSNVSTTISPSQYSVNIPSAPTGQLWPSYFTITYPISGSPIAAGTSLTVQRIIPLLQTTALSNQGNFYPQAVESALDVGVMQNQQISARTGQFRGTWLPSTYYNYGDVAQDGAAGLDSLNYYMCTLSYTSTSSWENDIATGYWVEIIPSTMPAATFPLSIANGGTGASTAAAAISNLGAASLSANNAFTGADTFTGGSIQVPTRSLGDSSLYAASTAFVSANGSVNSGIQNQAVYYSGTGVAVSGTNNLTVNGTGVAIGTGYTGVVSPTNGALIQGSIGIGTTTISSSNMLEVNGAASIGYPGAYGGLAGGLIVKGSVGIGTTAPQNTLQVSGGISTTGAITVAVPGSVYFDFQPGGASGTGEYVVVGTTTVNPAGQILSEFSTGGNAVKVFYWDTSLHPYFPNVASGALTSDYLCYDTSAVGGVIGEMTYQSSNCTVSIREMKDDIEPFAGSLEEAMALQPVTFYLKNERDFGKEIGLIAEDVEKVDPRLAVYDEKTSKLRSVQYDRIGVVAIGALQEQQKEIEQLRPGAFPFHKCLFNLLVCPD